MLDSNGDSGPPCGVPSVTAIFVPSGSPRPPSASVAPGPAAADRRPVGQSGRAGVDDGPGRKISTDQNPPPSDIRPQDAPLPGRSRCGRRGAGGSHDCWDETSVRRSAPGFGEPPVEPPDPPRSGCGLHNAPCSIRVGGWYGNAGRVGNPIPQSVICGVGDREDVWQAGLLLLCCYEAAVDPVIDDPHTDAVSLANLIDVERTGRKRRAGNAMLVADPSDHADREALAGRACEAVAVYHCDDLIVIERGCQGTDASNERIGITKRFGAVRRQA